MVRVTDTLLLRDPLGVCESEKLCDLPTEKEPSVGDSEEVVLTEVEADTAKVSDGVADGEKECELENEVLADGVTEAEVAKELWERVIEPELDHEGDGVQDDERVFVSLLSLVAVAEAETVLDGNGGDAEVVPENDGVDDGEKSLLVRSPDELRDGVIADRDIDSVAVDVSDRDRVDEREALATVRLRDTELLAVSLLGALRVAEAEGGENVVERVPGDCEKEGLVLCTSEPVILTEARDRVEEAEALLEGRDRDSEALGVTV